MAKTGEELRKMTIPEIFGELNRIKGDRGLKGKQVDAAVRLCFDAIAFKLYGPDYKEKCDRNELLAKQRAERKKYGRGIAGGRRQKVR